MGTLISNGTLLYRYNGLLLRSPLSRKIYPSRYLSYVVAGEYSNGSDPAMPARDLPFRGIQMQATLQNTKQVGFDLLSIYRTPRDANQKWQVMNEADRGAVWYQGGFGTSARNNLAPITSEACMSMSASRFNLGTVQGSDINISLSLKVGGVIEAYLAPGNSQNRVWQFSDSFYIHYAVLPSNLLNNDGPTSLHWNTIRNYKVGDFDLLPITRQLASSGLNGARDFWGYLDQSRNGGIPTLLNTPLTDIQLSQQALLAMQTYKDFWFVLYFEPIPESGMTIDNYGPYYSNNNIGWWACASVFEPVLSIQIP